MYRTAAQMTDDEKQKKSRSSGNFRRRSVKAPLTYFGSKARGVEIITRQLPPGITEVVMPCIGSGPVEITMAGRGVRVHGYDVEPTLVCFWKYLLRDGVRLQAEVKKHFPLGPDEGPRFRQLRKDMVEMEDSIERAAIYYVVNRKSWGGGTLSTGLSPKGERFTRRATHDLARFKAPLLSVECLDFEEALQRHPDIPAYLDPPYLMRIKGAGYYGVGGKLHSQFDHQRLFDCVKDRPQWVMSNANNDDVRALYAGFQMAEVSWKYGLRRNAGESELLIFSRDLAPQQ